MRLKLLLIFTLCFLTQLSYAQHKTETWKLKSLKKINGHKVSVQGQPKVIKGAGGKAIAFDGKDDGILVDANPILGAGEFTIEVDFKPYAGTPENFEQRFLHIQDPENPDRRILLELRLNDQQQWYADFFMRTDNASLVLIDSTKTHPTDKWATITMTYKDGIMRGYVNGVLESSGEIEYMPIGAAAKSSVGTRMDLRSWYKGAIREVRFSNKCLPVK